MKKQWKGVQILGAVFMFGGAALVGLSYWATKLAKAEVEVIPWLYVLFVSQFGVLLGLGTWIAGRIGEWLSD